MSELKAHHLFMTPDSEPIRLRLYGNKKFRHNRVLL